MPLKFQARQKAPVDDVLKYDRRIAASARKNVRHFAQKIDTSQQRSLDFAFRIDATSAV